MNFFEYNLYIEKYFQSKNINGALMLTSSWGRGKSYYVNNSLSKFFGDKCVKVSLYGLKSLEDISKSIYLAVRFKHIKKNEPLSYLKLLGKTISNGILGYFKINIAPKSEDLQNLFESIDLSDKLIILEDVERSDINILQILGYVNNLCEQENYKVLLVINEEETLANKGIAEDYARKKEKTVVDTIIFDCPIDEPIQNIIESFAYLKDDDGIVDKSQVYNLDFKKLIEGKSDYKYKEIVDIIKEILQNDANRHHGHGYNFRSLIFACQKTIDFFEEASKNCIEYDTNFFVACLFGIIAFSLKIKREDIRNFKWENDLTSPELLGHEKYPLLKICFEYVQNQEFNIESFIKIKNDFYLVRQREESWRKLKDCFKYSYDELLSTIDTIQNLIEKEIIPIESYGTIASQLFSIRGIIKEGNRSSSALTKISALIDLIKSKLNAVNCSSYELYDKVINPLGEVLLTKEAKNEYEKFKTEISQILIQKARDELIALTKSTDGITKFRHSVDAYERESGNLLSKIKKDFASKIDSSLMVKNLLSCSPSNVADFAAGFLKIYNVGNEEISSVSQNLNERNGKSIREMYEILPESIKNGTIDNWGLIDSSSQTSLIELRDSIDRKIESISAERNVIAKNEIDAIKELIQKLEDAVKNDHHDIILSYQIRLLIEGLRRIN